MKRFRLDIVGIIVVLSFLGLWWKVVWADLPTGASMSPVNSQFIDYKVKRDLGIVRSTNSAGHTLGYIPSPLALPARGVGLGNQSIVGSGALPAKFDLRVLGKLPPIRNQGACGDCWAHGAYSSLEGSLMSAASWDFSEAHLNDAHGFSIAWCDGGNDSMSTAYLSRWGGTVSDLAYPAPVGNTTTSYPVQTHVQNVDFLPSRLSALDNGAIKSALMDTGPVTISYYASDANAYNGSTYSV